MICLLISFVFVALLSSWIILTACNMRFVLNYNDGYEVGVEGAFNGSITTLPLRNFGDSQGDAKCFQLFDCPKLDYNNIILLIKNFKRSVKYRRLSSSRFIRL